MLPARLNPIFLLLLLLLAAPFSAAERETSPQAEFVALSAGLSDDTDGQARFVGLRVPGYLDAHDSWFHARGRAVDVTTDTADSFVEVSPVAGSPLPPSTAPGAPSGVDTETKSYGEAVVEGIASRTNRFLYVLGDEGSSVRFQTACSTVQVPESKDVSLTVPPVVNSSRPSERRDTTAALEVVPCTGRDLTVLGSFTVIFWEWDFTVTSQGKAEPYWTGLGQSMPMADARPYFGSAQQAFVEVQEGAFTIRGSADFPPVLYLEDVQLETSRLDLRSASGNATNLPDTVQGDLLELAGQMRVGLQRGPGGLGLGVTVFSGLKALAVDGQAVPLTTTSTPVGLPRWAYILAAGLVGAVPLAVVPAVVIRKKQEALIVQREDTEHLVQGHRLEEALPSSVRLVESMPRDPGANLLLATSMRRLGHSSQALGHLSRAREPGWLRPLDAIGSAELDLEAALAAFDLSVGEANPVQAEQWRDMARNLVRRAVQADRGVLLDLEAYPGLDALYWETETPR